MKDRERVIRTAAGVLCVFVFAVVCVMNYQQVMMLSVQLALKGMRSFLPETVFFLEETKQESTGISTTKKQEQHHSIADSFDVTHNVSSLLRSARASC